MRCTGESPPSTTNQRSRFVLYSLITVAFLAILSMYIVLIYVRTPQARWRQNQGLPIVGTWVGEHGNFLSIRADGTARSRSSKTSGDIGYFEWSLDSRELRIFQYAKKHNLGWFVRRALLDDTPTDSFEIVTITPTEFTLRSKDGDVVTFVSANDHELEMAP